MFRSKIFYTMAAGVVVLLTIVVFMVGNLNDINRINYASAYNNQKNVVRTLSQAAEYYLKEYNSSFATIAANFKNHVLVAQDKHVIETFLNSAAAILPGTKSMIYIKNDMPHVTVIGSYGSKSKFLADDDLKRLFKQVNNSQRQEIINPFICPNGKLVYALARPIWSADGPNAEKKYHGVLIAFLDIKYLNSILLNNAVLPKNSSLLLMDNTGLIITGFNSSWVGKHYWEVPNSKDENSMLAFLQMMKHQEGHLDLTKKILAFNYIALDGKPFLSIAVKTPLSDMQMISGLAKRQFAFGMGIIILFLGVFLLLFKEITSANKTKYQLEEANQIRLNEQLMFENEKLSVISELAASTAHEIRNPLTVIKGFIEILHKKSIKSETEEYFSIIENEILGIEKVINEYLLFSKTEVSEKKPYSLIKILSELTSIIKNETVINNIKLFTYWDASLPELFGDEVQLKHLLYNLLSNAIQAMPNGGNLTLRAESTKEGVEIRISDTGVGMAKDTLRKIGTPFFTTKEKGTGLGIAVCRRIVERYDGKIYFDSNLGLGTVVTIIIPKS